MLKVVAVVVNEILPTDTALLFLQTRASASEALVAVEGRYDPYQWGPPQP